MDLYNQLANNMEELCSTFQSRMTQYEVGLKQLSQSTEEHPLNSLPALSKDYKDFKQLVWTSIRAIKSQMELLCLGLARHEAASRRKVLLFHGIEESKDIKMEVQKIITERLKLPEISSNDIATCHFLGSDTERSRPLLVRFQQYKHRDLVWKTKTSLKNSGITISEFLIKSRHDMFVAARKHFGVKNCWTTEGKIVVLLPDKSRQKIEVMSELRTLMAKFPTASSTLGSGQEARLKPLNNIIDSTPVKAAKAGRSKRIFK